MSSTPEIKQVETHQFGPYKIRTSEVFLSTPLSLAMVNLKPVVPGHVLIIPRRVALRFQDLSHEEVADIWTLAQRVGSVIEPHFGAVSLTFAIQDGAAAGQTVPHVHIHCLPRKMGDFENNDEVYDKIDEHAEQMKERLDLDKERVVRTPDEMAAEAAELRVLFT
ncbi:hypothetical protein CYMTET_34549 [Cymbomonas tetramitiformis]|uniref:HIT domain-containing protein n=1 Tax=Cymbomonas tetramitiformis TaxID=36881 RepID=A0AAE0KPV0_9CHLO|nr:hypothetical protein CYMTET_34549 [Cymbomonas tetramitiformis]